MFCAVSYFSIRSTPAVACKRSRPFCQKCKLNTHASCVCGSQQSHILSQIIIYSHIIMRFRITDTVKCLLVVRSTQNLWHCKTFFGFTVYTEHVPSRQQFYVASAVGLLISWEKRYTDISAKRLRLISRWDAQQVLKLKKKKKKKKKDPQKRHKANVLRKLTLQSLKLEWGNGMVWQRGRM